MVINMDESRPRTIEQIEQFLGASALVAFSPPAGDSERYEHISRVLKRFDYPQRNKRERGVLLRYLRHTSGYSRSQLTRLVRQWEGNRLAPAPLAKRYGVPAAPFARKYTPGDVALLVGGPDGLAPECLARATQRWSLSPLTLPHGLARVVLAEALYRAFSLLKGHPYHRAGSPSGL